MTTSKLVFAALGVALLATPAFAQKTHRQVSHQQYQSYQSGGVQFDGKTIGADPDANIRSELSRDAGSSVGAY